MDLEMQARSTVINSSKMLYGGGKKMQWTAHSA